METTLIQDLSILQYAAICNEEENQHFKTFLKRHNSRQVDEIVHDLNTIISPQIDCTQCGNCCRSLMINVEPDETADLSAHLNIPLNRFKDMYIEESEQGQMIINTIPCHFLNNNKCSIYEHRFNECREFPHLNKTAFTSRLFGTFMHYGRCPIVFNVIEELKIRLSFQQSAISNQILEENIKNSTADCC